MILRFLPHSIAVIALALVPGLVHASEIDQILAKENAELGVTSQPMKVVDDMTFLRRASVDLIGRIPSGKEIRQFMEWPAGERREKLIEKLIDHDRFAYNWTVFFGDMMRLRSNATGGAALTAYIHKAISENMPYDELCRRLIATNGKANATPEVGFVLGDDADPMALASVTAQVFMGIRISCAQCHDHPFDKWTREDFYSLAAFYGKTRRVESQRTRVVYTTEDRQSTVLWPPYDGAEDDGVSRSPMVPSFPFEMIPEDAAPDFLVRFEKLRQAEQKKADALAQAERNAGPSVDDLLAGVEDKVEQQTRGGLPGLGVTSEAKEQIRRINLAASLYRHSELRSQLADLVTSPRNRYFARAMVNRLWKHLVGRGFVEAVDDFREDNPPSHPATLDHISDGFVASGYDFRALVKMIVATDAYQRAHAPDGVDDLTRQDLEGNFLATPMRRMMSEALYDSIVVAGHLFDVKHLPGQNEVVRQETIRVPKQVEGKPTVTQIASISTAGNASSPAMMANQAMPAPAGYALEDAIELDFDSLLAEKDEAVKVDKMQIMSAEELEAQRMLMESRTNRPGVEYVTKIVERIYDLNPRFNSSLRMAAPAPEGHFLRVFGQTNRTDLGIARDDDPTMRQALMMLNGRLTNEASRVGPLEPIYRLLDGKKADVSKAVKMAYYEILTRQPTEIEVAEGKEIVAGASNPLDGMADLRWVLLNCNEFRFLP